MAADAVWIRATGAGLLMVLLTMIRSVAAADDFGCMAKTSGSVCYTYEASSTTWDIAQTNCTQEQPGGALVSIPDQATQTYLENALFNDGTPDVWIGATKTEYVNWKWDDESDLGAFSRWEGGYPTGTSECVVMDKSTNPAYLWKNVPCGGTPYDYMCSFSTACPTSPPTLPDYDVMCSSTCYRIFTEATTYFPARDACHQQGGLLATVSTESTFDCLVNSLTESVWIGLHRADWNWTDGSIVTYSTWASNYPTPTTGNASYMTLPFGAPGYFWKNDFQNETRAYICQYPEVITTTGVVDDTTLVATTEQSTNEPTTFPTTTLETTITTTITTPTTYAITDQSTSQLYTTTQTPTTEETGATTSTQYTTAQTATTEETVTPTEQTTSTQPVTTDDITTAQPSTDSNTTIPVRTSTSTETTTGSTPSAPTQEQTSQYSETSETSTGTTITTSTGTSSSSSSLTVATTTSLVTSATSPTPAIVDTTDFIEITEVVYTTSDFMEESSSESSTIPSTTTITTPRTDSTTAPSDATTLPRTDTTETATLTGSSQTTELSPTSSDATSLPVTYTTETPTLTATSQTTESSSTFSDATALPVTDTTESPTPTATSQNTESSSASSDATALSVTNTTETATLTGSSEGVTASSVSSENVTSTEASSASSTSSSTLSSSSASSVSSVPVSPSLWTTSITLVTEDPYSNSSSTREPQTDTSDGGVSSSVDWTYSDIPTVGTVTSSATASTVTEPPDSNSTGEDTGYTQSYSGSTELSTGTTIQNTGSTTPNTGSTTPNTGSTTPNTGSTTPNTGSTTPNTGFTTPNTGSTTPNTGSTTPNTGFTTPNTGSTTPNTGSTTPNTGSTTPNTGSTTPTTGSTTPNTGSTTPNTGSTTPYTGSSTLSSTVSILLTDTITDTTTEAPVAGLTTAQIVGIVFGLVAVLLILIILLLLCLARRRRITKSGVYFTTFGTNNTTQLISKKDVTPDTAAEPHAAYINPVYDGGATAGGAAGGLTDQEVDALYAKPMKRISNNNKDVTFFDINSKFQGTRQGAASSGDTAVGGALSRLPEVLNAAALRQHQAAVPGLDSLPEESSTHFGPEYDYTEPKGDGPNKTIIPVTNSDLTVVPNGSAKPDDIVDNCRLVTTIFIPPYDSTTSGV